MTRLILALDKDVSYLACANPPPMPPHGPKFIQLKRDNSFVSRAMRKFGLGRQRSDFLELEAAARDPSVKVILFNYLPFALEYESVFRQVGKPLFVHCHGYDMTWDLRRPGFWGPAVFSSDYTARVRHLASYATLLTNSSFSQQRLLDVGVPRSQIAVRPFGIPAPVEGLARRLNGGVVKILFLGRLVDFKGPDLLIRAFERAVQMGTQAELSIAGDGPLRPLCESLRRRSSCKERIQFLGAVDEQEGDRLRQEAHIFSAHSRKGPFSNQEEMLGVAFLEAMSAGLPVITGRSGGIPEYIEDGKTGILIAPGDVEGHALAIKTLAADPELRERIGTAARRHVHDNYSMAQERGAIRRLLALSD